MDLKDLVTWFSQAGISGVLLAVFLWIFIQKIFPAFLEQQEKYRVTVENGMREIAEEQKAQWQAIDRNNRLSFLRMASSPALSSDMKDAAKNIVQEIDTAAAEAKAREITNRPSSV